MIIVCYGGRGASEIKILEPVLEEDKLNDILFTASKLLAQRENGESAQVLANLNFKLSNGTNALMDKFLVLHTYVPVEMYQQLYLEEEKAKGKTKSYREFKKPYRAIAQVMDELGHSVRFIIYEASKSTAPDNWRSYFNNSTVNNQAMFDFKDSIKISFQGLSFRSKTEVKIYEALLKRGLLIMPLPVMVMGVKEKYKEPDFVVCYNGRIGILEIHGEQWHPPQTAATEHERRREFTKLGINVYEIFDSKRCWGNPDDVVDDFIQAFTQAR